VSRLHNVAWAVACCCLLCRLLVGMQHKANSSSRAMQVAQQPMVNSSSSPRMLLQQRPSRQQHTASRQQHTAPHKQAMVRPSPRPQPQGAMVLAQPRTSSSSRHQLQQAISSLLLPGPTGPLLLLQEATAALLLLLQGGTATAQVQHTDQVLLQRPLLAQHTPSSSSTAQHSRGTGVLHSSTRRGPRRSSMGRQPQHSPTAPLAPHSSTALQALPSSMAAPPSSTGVQLGSTVAQRGSTAAPAHSSMGAAAVRRALQGLLLRPLTPPPHMPTQMQGRRQAMAAVLPLPGSTGPAAMAAARRVTALLLLVVGTGRHTVRLPSMANRQVVPV
jgi:hypothetical protein